MEWKIVYAHHEECKNNEFGTIAALEQSGFDRIEASVPGNFELDLMKAGKIDDLFFSTNTWDAQKMEDINVWYYTTLEITEQNQYLSFGGIDTYADIYVNGKFIRSTDNMFLSYDIFPEWKIGQNEVVVHMKPVMLETRKQVPPAGSYALRYNHASLYARKAAHMFGWDIMPRILSAGLWKEVRLLPKKVDSIREVYLVTNKVYKKGETDCASLRFFMNTELSGVFAKEYKVKIEGNCGGKTFEKEEILWHNTHSFIFDVEDCFLWWPKNYGRQNLYDVKVTLYRNEEICDEYHFKYGIRTVELERTEYTVDKDGEFCFKVNGKKIFALGTNWVPLDAFHSNDIHRLPKALEMLDDIGCNFVRCWGGNVYEANEFYEFCDEKGILIWQDFAMGCAIYPDDEFFRHKLEEEAVFQIKRLRNHAALILWAGDNECDMAYEWIGFYRDPNENGVTRNVLKRAVELHDYSRPYLPSSPYVSPQAYAGKGTMPEMHLWGPRDYFKGDYYKNTFCHFASETGYHGFPSLQSLKKFLKNPEKIFNEDGTPTDEYLAHAASMDTGMNQNYAYRIKLAYDQVLTLFGEAEEKIEDFIYQSQISQAEAKKYFIERFRVEKWDRTGIIWWNLLDGWPQVSDAVVDYYYVKKLAYHYIRRSQEAVCLMFDEPENSRISLMGVNDLQTDKEIVYNISKVIGTEKIPVMDGKAMLSANQAQALTEIEISPDEKTFFLIEWTMDGKAYKNHYFTNILDIDYRKYMQALNVCGMNEFEGF